MEEGREADPDGLEVAPDERPGLAPGDRGRLGPDLLEEFRSVVRIPYPAQEAEQHLPVHQEPRGPDLDGREHLEQFAGGAGLEFEEPFEIAAIVVRADWEFATVRLISWRRGSQETGRGIGVDPPLQACKIQQYRAV